MTQITTPAPEDWRVLVAQKRKQLDQQIPADWRLSGAFISSLPKDGRLIEADVARRGGILSDGEVDITENYSAAQLLQKLAGGELTSLAVTTAFCKRAAIAQQLVRDQPVTVLSRLLITPDVLPNGALLRPCARTSPLPR